MTVSDSPVVLEVPTEKMSRRSHATRRSLSTCRRVGQKLGLKKKPNARTDLSHRLLKTRTKIVLRSLTRVLPAWRTSSRFSAFQLQLRAVEVVSFCMVFQSVWTLTMELWSSPRLYPGPNVVFILLLTFGIYF